MNHRVLTFLCALAFSAPLAADVLTAPGEFPNVQAAVVAAQDGDTVLVGLGAPAENILIEGKGLTLITRGPEVTMRRLIVANVPADSAVVIRGLFFNGSTGPFPNQYGIHLSDSAGWIHIESCRALGNRGYQSGQGSPLVPAPGAFVERCDAVVFSDVELTGGTAADYPPGGFFEPADGAHGLHVDDSSVEVSGSLLQAGMGGAGDPYEFPTPNDGNGGDGLYNDDGFVSLSGCSVAGANAGQGTNFGGGGDGIRQVGIDARLWMRDLDLSFGLGSGGGSPIGDDGSPLVISAGFTRTFDGGHRALGSASPIVEQQAGALTLFGAAGEQSMLLVSLEPTFAPLLANQGVLSLGPPYLATVFPGAIPPDGSLELAYQAPPLGVGFDALDVRVQAAFSDGVVLRLATASVVTWVDSNF